MKIRALAVVLVFVSYGALGQPGVFEINEACVSDGCFPGDQSGLPVEISSPGKYQLTSDLHVQDSSTHAIRITVDNVHLNLNGYTLQGPNVCDVSSGSCSPGGGGRGVSLANFNDQEGVRLTDGQIDGFGNYCASIGFAGYAADLTVSNCFAGIGVGRGAVAERINSYNNKYGIDLTAEAILRDSTAVDNILNGVQVNVIDRRVIIENNQIIGNGSSGIFAKGPILADNNFISTNSIGIYVSDDAAGSKIEGNVIHDNENTGLYVQDLSGVAGIALSGNALSRNGPSDTSPQISGDNASRVVEISANMCNDNTVCD